MDTLQRKLEDLFCPPLDSALVAAIIGDVQDFNACVEILNHLAKEANLELDAERFAFGPNYQWSENSNSNSNSSSSSSSNNNSTTSENFNHDENDKLKPFKGRRSSKNKIYPLYPELGNSPYPPSSSDEGAVSGLDHQMGHLYVTDDFDSGCSIIDSDGIAWDEEVEQLGHYDKSPLDFLKACFPKISNEKLESLLRRYPHDYDLIFNELFLEAERKDSELAYLSSASTSSSFDTRDMDCDDGLSSEARFKHRKKKRRRQPSKNIIFKINAHLSIPDNSALLSSTSSKSPSFNSFRSSTSENCWVSFENQIQQLRNMLPTIPLKKIISTFHANHGKLMETAQELILLCSSEPSSKQEIFDQSLGQLIGVFPNHDFEILKKALVASGGTSQKAIELLLISSSNFSSDIISNNGKVLGSNNSSKPEKMKNRLGTSSSPFLPAGVVFNHDTASSSPVIDRYACRSDLKHKEEENDDYDPQFCREKARQYMEKRNEAFGKAMASFNKARGHRKDGEGGIASYYSNEGHRFDSQMKTWNLRAARSSVKRHRDASGDHNLLDLHGLSVKEALTVVKEGLEQWYSSVAGRDKPLKIVTGQGNHSPNGIAKLPPAIARMLDKENWDVVTNQGYFLVRGVKV
ncbi:hypothetical protein G9A89_008979 [Geosiphon pyriformis]|nr:hypothetical protein G9A89_008979 [Geosiphon pyriformis]